MISKVTCYCFYMQCCAAIDLSYFGNSTQCRSLYGGKPNPSNYSKKRPKSVIRVEVAKTIVVKESKSICQLKYCSRCFSFIFIKFSSFIILKQVTYSSKNLESLILAKAKSYTFAACIHL